MIPACGPLFLCLCYSNTNNNNENLCASVNINHACGIMLSLVFMNIFSSEYLFSFCKL